MANNDRQKGDDPLHNPVSGGQDCQAVRALIPAYSIGATDPDETAFVESRLADCPDIAAELAEYRRLSGVLVYGVPRRPVPADLHDKILAQLQPDPIQPGPHVPIHPVRQTNFRDRAKQLLVVRRLHPNLLVTGLAIILLVITNLYWAVQIANLHHAQQQMNSMLEEHNAVLALIGAGEAHRIELQPMEQENVEAVLLCDPEEELAFLYVEAFPALSPGTIYQLWLLRGQQRVNTGAFRVNEAGDGTFVFRAPEPLGHFDVVEITLDPIPVSSQPTLPPVARGLLNY